MSKVTWCGRRLAGSGSRRAGHSAFSPLAHTLLEWETQASGFVVFVILTGSLSVAMIPGWMQTGDR